MRRSVGNLSMAKRSLDEQMAWLGMAAEQARHNLTPAQAKLWELIKPLGFLLEYEMIATTKNGGKYPYRFDFYHPELKIAVEIDGGYHSRTRGRDRGGA